MSDNLKGAAALAVCLLAFASAAARGDRFGTCLHAATSTAVAIIWAT